MKGRLLNKDIWKFGCCGLAALLLASVMGIAPEYGYGQTHRRPAGPARKPATPVTNPAATTGEQPRYKAIWEPKNYPDDLTLLDVFFVNDRVGWISGARDWNVGGFILKTTDGGDHWAMQLGDPHSSDPHITNIRFIDETHGWAVQFNKFVTTSDGQNWEDGGVFLPYGGLVDYAFTSPTHGIFVGGNAGETSRIFTTHNAGHTWKPVFQCATRLEVNGLTQNTGCYLYALQFPTAAVGYAVGGSNVDDPRGGFFVVAKTEDGGESWRIVYTVSNIRHATTVFFTNTNTGFTRNNDGKFYATTDGGLSWRGVTGSGDNEGYNMTFVDPEVGWSPGDVKQGFTTNGGTYWNSREIHFPVRALAYSFPSRNRGYTIGEHGMIYRYRVVPIDYNVANMFEAPMMPGYGVSLQPQVQRVKLQIQALQAKLQAAMAQSGGSSGASQAAATISATSAGPSQSAAAAQDDATSQGDSSGGGFAQDTLVADGFTQSTSDSVGVAGSNDAAVAGSSQASGQFAQDSGAAAPSAFIQSCCATEVQNLQNSSGILTQSISAVTTRYRTLNLILAGMRRFSDLVAKAQGMRNSFVALKSAKDPQSAMTALSQFSNSMADMTRTASDPLMNQSPSMGAASPGSFQQQP